MSLEYSKKYYKQLEQAVENEENQFLIQEFSGKHYADISEILYQLDGPSCKYILELLGPDVRADVISDLEEDIRIEFLKQYTAEEVAEVIDHLDSDDAVDLLNEQPIKAREEVLTAIQDSEQAAYIMELLHYDEDCAGGLMAKELIRANINWTVKQCIDEIRRQAERVEKIMTVYVVDDHNILMGRVSLKEIILSKDDTKIQDIYVPEIALVHTFQQEEEVAELMQKYDLEVVPVVNVQGKLLGRITIDDIVDVITEQAEIDQQAMAGISENVESSDGIWALTRARLPWLIVGMIGGLFGAQFIGVFENELTLVPAMAFFIPLITATGGNVGIQSSTIMVQSMAGSSYIHDTLWDHFVKVIGVAGVNGLTMASLVFGFNYFFAGPELAMVVSSALFCVVMLASVMGTVTPVVLDRFGINPALASGPFITTANDLLGLGVYFSVAKMLLHL
ncbi:magnesium transporter [Algivirga pacifica]|uniref:Magnesium transporter MgtE n=1 Tax=Algivirga pacifica TaxID=1162670 RepID=A0ABP9DIA0_9BACT